ncbi:AEC family transporter [Acinetobacter sp. CFCC 10889]|uniref:AEC family transporter n=1 Tax=Acinetobacter sp. CFCC 10889 TaxID=1775557 RepID=UPI000DD0D57C|nr:AEC family transporter [Acinetobacter sp. CFCC 10889]
MAQILISLFPLLVLIVGGNILQKTGFLSDGFWSGAEKLNYYVLFPAMLFANLATATIHIAMLQTIFTVLALVLLITCIVLYIIRAVQKTDAARFGVYMQGMVRFNTYMGLAIVAALFSQQGLTILAITLAMCIPLVNILSVLALTRQDSMNVKSIFVSLLKNPLILACIVGIIFNFSGLILWAGFADLIKQLGICSLPLGLLCVGAALQFMALKKQLWVLLLNTFARLLIMPALAYMVCIWLGLTQLETQVLVLFFALPTASASYILTKVLGGDHQLMAGVISLQTLCSVLTLPIVLLWVM